jgi:hypothetical protein
MSRRWGWTFGVLLLLVVLVIAVSFIAERPLRRLVERQLNACVQGYTAQIGGLDLRPLALSVRLRDLHVVQDAHPEPPLVLIPRVTTDLRLAPLLRGHLVASVIVVESQINVRWAQLVHAMETPGVVVQDCTLLKMMKFVHAVDVFRLHDASVSYVDQAEARPLTVRALSVDVRNIRIQRSGTDADPSPLKVEALVFDEGRLHVDGAADLLRQPYAAFKGRVEVVRVPIDRLGPLVAPYGLTVRRGTLGLAGSIEYAPHLKVVDLEYVNVDGLQADYAYRKVAAQPVKETVKAAADKAQQVIRGPNVRLTARRISITNAILGFVYEDVRPPYRIYLSEIGAQMENVSSQLTEGTMTTRVTARFMGSGDTVVAAAVRPAVDGPDFDLSARIENVDVKKMNDMFRAHGKIDVASGRLSVYSEFHVKNRRVNGYVKPLLHDLKLNESELDREKSVGQRIKEKTVTIVGKLLRNRPRQDIATTMPIAGPLEDPKADTWATMVYLIQNAFFKAILPGFVGGEAGARP